MQVSVWAAFTSREAEMVLGRIEEGF